MNVNEAKLKTGKKPGNGITVPKILKQHIKDNAYSHVRFDIGTTISLTFYKQRQYNALPEQAKKDFYLITEVNVNESFGYRMTIPQNVLDALASKNPNLVLTHVVFNSVSNRIQKQTTRTLLVSELNTYQRSQAEKSTFIHSFTLTGKYENINE